MAGDSSESINAILLITQHIEHNLQHLNRLVIAVLLTSLYLHTDEVLHIMQCRMDEIVWQDIYIQVIAGICLLLFKFFVIESIDDHVVIYESLLNYFFDADIVTVSQRFKASEEIKLFWF